MQKNYSLKMFFVALFCCFFSFASAQLTATYDFATNPWELPVSDGSNQTAGNITAPITQDDVTLTTTDGSTATRLWLSGDAPQLRCYTGATLTLSVENAQILSVVFTADATKYANFTTTVGTYENSSYTWTGEAASVVFTAGASARIHSIIVTYKKDGQTVVTTPTVEGTDNFEESTDITISGDEGLRFFYTLDGSDPTTSSTQYTSSINITETTTIKAIAVDSEDNMSGIVTKTFNKKLKAVVNDIYTLTTADNITEGVYVFAFEKDGKMHIMKDAVKSNYYVDYTEADLSTTELPAVDNLFTIAMKDGGYTIQGSDGNYIGIVASGNYRNLKIDQTNENVWAFAAGEGNTIKASYQGIDDAYFIYSDAHYNYTAGTPLEGENYGSNQMYYPSFYRVSDEALGNIVKTPTITPEAQDFIQEIEVTIAAEEGCTIYYTTNGDEPTISATEYTAPFKLNETSTVKAIAVNSKGTLSEIAEATYTLINENQKTEDFDFVANTWGLPVGNIEPAGNITEPIVQGDVTLTCTDGSTATRLWDSNGTLQFRIYTGGAIKLETSKGKIVKVEFVSAGKFNLTTTEGTLDDKTWTGDASSVTFNVGGTNYLANIIVSYVDDGTITVTAPTIEGTDNFENSTDLTFTADENTTIYYTLDGTTPTQESSVVGVDAITITETTTVKAIAVDVNGNESEVTTATFNKKKPLIVNENFVPIDLTNIQEGNYIIAYHGENSTLILKNETYSSYYVATTEFDISAPNLPASENLFSLKKVENGYTLQGQNGQYLEMVVNGTHTNLVVTGEGSNAWNFEYAREEDYTGVPANSIIATYGDVTDKYMVCNPGYTEYTANTPKLGDDYLTSYNLFPILYRVNDDLVGITATQKVTKTNNDVYTLDGRLIRKNATSLNGLAKGIYIMNGKKILVK